MTTEPFATSELFLWGGVGGGVGALATYTIPWLVGLTRGQPRPALWQAIGGTGLLLAHAMAGGVAALFVGEATLPRQAIVFGLAWPTVLQGAAKTYKAISGAPDGGHAATDDGEAEGLPPGPD